MRWLGGWVAVLAMLGLSASPASAAQPLDPDNLGTDYFVTVAARVCDSYADITANKARNNIQESLRDLGPNTNYPTPSEYVNPTREQAGQSKCRPLSGFRFTFGTTWSGKTVNGSWGSLSIVDNPFPTDITTIDSVPDRDGTGKILTAAPAIAGATTVELSADERALVAKGEVRIQGGTVDDPVLDPGTYAFGALRCSDDNQNGDNIEFVRFPGALRHVYCFAYYVVPPPTSGTIIITKSISDPPNGDGVFTFKGNISYTPTHDFTLTVVNGAAKSSQPFYRAASTTEHPVTWTVGEDTAASPGWDLTGIECTAPMGSTITRDPPTAPGVSISLVGGDTVHCTFTDALKPQPGSLLITKLTTGDTGTFPFVVRDLAGTVVLATRATTTAPKQAAAADRTPLTLKAGTYEITEGLPEEDDGDWESVTSGCDAQQTRTRRPRRRSGPPPLPVTITRAKGRVCTFTNHFIPDGSIEITKTTLGGTGSTSFTISPYANPAVEYSQAVTTTAENAPKRALGDLTGRLALGSYLIQEHGTVSGRNGDWALVSVTCDGQPRPFAQGQVVVDLTEDRPDRSCNFVNEFTPAPAPEPPNPPTPPNTLGPVLPSFPTAPPDLVVTKRALQSSVRLGSTAEYEITVRNAGPVPAEDVVVSDTPGRHGQLVSARAAQADCDERVPLICRVGRLAAGEEATIRVRMRATGAPVMRNLAVAGSATLDPRLRNNVAAARVRVRGAGQVVGRCARAGPIAHAAC